LECLKRVHKLNHFALRAKLYVEALQHAFSELRRLKAAA
ncbi:MAG: IS701 family transposase, partial [Gammaproteobacteria bacterium]